MKILFWLYRSHLNSKGFMPLMMRITFKAQRINFPTQIGIPEHQWDKEKQLSKGTDDLTLRQNRFLLTLTTKAWDYYDVSIRQDKAITVQQITKFVLGESGAHHTLLEAMDYQNPGRPTICSL